MCIGLRFLRLSMVVWAISCAGQVPKPDLGKNIGKCEPTVPIPAAALRALLRTKEAEGAREYLSQSADHKASDVFLATKIHLSDDKRTDLVVCGTNIQTTGGDNNWYWIIADAYAHPRVVLWAGTDELLLLRGRTNGYRDIRSYWNTPSDGLTTVYRFDGTRYYKASRRWSVIEP